MEALLPWLLDFTEDITKNKDPVRAREFWLKLAWEITNCLEANEVFPDMRICPVCLERAKDGFVDHKFRGEILN